MNIHGKVQIDGACLVVAFLLGEKMLDLQLRDKNNIITMTSPGKTPLQGRRGSGLYYHNSLDFILAAVGTCAGGSLIDYCRLNDLNPAIFSNIRLFFSDDKFIIAIKRPSDFEEVHMERIKSRLSNCTMKNYLAHPIEIQWALNEVPIEELIKEPKGCCGQ